MNYYFDFIIERPSFKYDKIPAKLRHVIGSSLLYSIKNYLFFKFQNNIVDFVNLKMTLR